MVTTDTPMLTQLIGSCWRVVNHWSEKDYEQWGKSNNRVVQHSRPAQTTNKTLPQKHRKQPINKKAVFLQRKK